jgi:hypothetical protein
MKSWIVAMVMCLSVSGPNLASAASGRAAQAGLPQLAWATVSGYRFAVAGRYWGSATKVTFSLRQGFPNHEEYPVEGLVVKTAKDGTFLFGLNNIDLCNGEIFKARDFKGHRAGIIGPVMNCAPNPHPPIPVLTVVRGTMVAISVTHVDRFFGIKPIVIRLGNALYLWQKGPNHPFWIPSAPSSSFERIGRGLTPFRRCNQTECAAGFFWEWVAMKVGRTFVSMDTWCRAHRPYCAVPSFQLRVRITASGQHLRR